MTALATTEEPAPLDFLRLALAASLRAAALGRGAMAVQVLPRSGSEGWGQEWLASVSFARAEAQRWRALVNEVTRHRVPTPWRKDMEEKALELSKIERQAATLLAQVSRAVDSQRAIGPPSVSETCDSIA